MRGPRYDREEQLRRCNAWLDHMGRQHRARLHLLVVGVVFLVLCAAISIQMLLGGR